MPIPVSASSPTPPSHPSIASFLDRLALAPRQSYKALTIWPLVLAPGAPETAAPRYESLADALDAGRIRVDEVGGAGRVPVVRVENRGEVAVLVLFGEELRGAKQNRVANASFLAPPRSEVVIDVSCVEQGRWHRPDGAGFSAAREVLSHSLRTKMAKKVAEARAFSDRFRADQYEVWEEVAARIAHSGAHSHTGAYRDYMESRRSESAEYGRAFHPVERQVGFVAAIGDEIAGLEAIGRPDVFARTFPGLVRAYVVDAIDSAFLKTRESAETPRFEAPEAFFEALRRAPFQSSPSLGLGEDVRVAGAGVGGCALVADDVVHMTAFPSPEA